jgi:uncharacterized SAM-binding protein YcdF (DUF218 family)
MTKLSGGNGWWRGAPLAVKLIVASAGAVAAWVASAWALDVVGGNAAPSRVVRPTWDAIVVLGCRVGRDGTPSLAMRRRVGHAVELFREGRAPRIVMTGGQGDDEPLSEARAAARLAEDLGVPREAILMEEASQSTEENAERARRVLGGGHVIVVSDAYHITRGARVFERYFERVDATGIRGAPIGGALREVAALAIYALLGRLDGPDPVPVEQRLATAATMGVSERPRGRGWRRARPRRPSCEGSRRRSGRSPRRKHRRPPCPSSAARRGARPSRAARAR